ncbi:UNKNOWN [Stylonychia lemnae]|uniref:Uncharacterized protein n=1 Tax=Stylonychia lemnae TaxID=5949 RepID=A0A077ZRD4_STYLE|nr:UNKNOWN [Stylonychia lemnae]|eukprot:CDW71900.1 UNKNOWN [Stylonychia lemnae]
MNCFKWTQLRPRRGINQNLNDPFWYREENLKKQNNKMIQIINMSEDEAHNANEKSVSDEIVDKLKLMIDSEFQTRRQSTQNTTIIQKSEKKLRKHIQSLHIKEKELSTAAFEMEMKSLNFEKRQAEQQNQIKTLELQLFNEKQSRQRDQIQYLQREKDFYLQIEKLQKSMEHKIDSQRQQSDAQIKDFANTRDKEKLMIMNKLELILQKLTLLEGQSQFTQIIDNREEQYCAFSQEDLNEIKDRLIDMIKSNQVDNIEFNEKRYQSRSPPNSNYSKYIMINADKMFKSNNSRNSLAKLVSKTQQNIRNIRDCSVESESQVNELQSQLKKSHKKILKLEETEQALKQIIKQRDSMYKHKIGQQLKDVAIQKTQQSTNTSSRQSLTSQQKQDELETAKNKLHGELEKKLVAIEGMNKTLDQQKRELSIIKSKVNQITSPPPDYRNMNEPKAKEVPSHNLNLATLLKNQNKTSSCAQNELQNQIQQKSVQTHYYQSNSIKGSKIKPSENQSPKIIYNGLKQENRRLSAALKPCQSDKSIPLSANSRDSVNIQIPTITTKLNDDKYKKFEQYIAINNQKSQAKIQSNQDYMSENWPQMQVSHTHRVNYLENKY